MAEVHEKERQLQEEIERVSGENQQSRYPERTAWGHSWNTGYDAWNDNKATIHGENEKEKEKTIKQTNEKKGGVEELLVE